MITWRCHICGETRPNDKISVVTLDATSPSMVKGTVSVNTRYCNDSRDCVLNAQRMAQQRADKIKKL